jgi:hypothetical protein
LQYENLTKKPNMKNLIRLLFLLVVGGFILTSCEGPQGPAGKDANTVCLTCHNTANFDAKEAQYHLSKHYYGTSSARNTKYCARCHTNEGFKEITGDGKFVVANDIPMATRITCETCHKHSTFEFPEDTVSAVLRTITPVYLNYYKNATTQDFGSIDNLCCTCHQIRGITTPTVYKNRADSIARKADPTWNQLPFFPLDNTLEATTIQFKVGQSFAVHDGNQSNLFAGINGYEYAGKTYTRTWKHSSYTCIDCHMNDYDPTTNTGGHTMIPNEAVCTTCHTSDKLTPIQTNITAKIAELGEALVAKKLFKKTISNGVASYSAVPSHDYYGVLFPTTQSTTTYGIALTNYNTVSPTTGLVVPASTVKIGVEPDFALRIGREWKYGELGAAYNFGYINSELSLGIHNPTYALQILQNSIDYLNSY